MANRDRFRGGGQRRAVQEWWRGHSMTRREEASSENIMPLHDKPVEPSRTPFRGRLTEQNDAGQSGGPAAPPAAPPPGPLEIRRHPPPPPPPSRSEKVGPGVADGEPGHASPPQTPVPISRWTAGPVHATPGGGSAGPACHGKSENQVHENYCFHVCTLWFGRHRRTINI